MEKWIEDIRERFQRPIVSVDYSDVGKLVSHIEWLEAQCAEKDKVLENLLKFAKAHVLTGWQRDEPAIKEAERMLSQTGGGKRDEREVDTREGSRNHR